MKPEGRSSLAKDKQEELQKHDAAIKGGMEEESVYNKLRDCLKKNNVKNTVVINGWKDNGSKTRTQKEFDFLIVSQPSQTVIHIEVKRTCSDSNMKSATKQLENGLKMFQETVPFPKSQSWNYIRVIYFGLARKVMPSEGDSSSHNKEEKPFKNKCLDCKNFIIGTETDFNLWWEEINGCLPQKNTKMIQGHLYDTYLNVLRFLLHQMYKQQDCATLGQLVELTHQTSDKICNPDTIMFWSKDQYKTLNDFKDKKVALTSGFGTGKTILIKAKAKELIASGQPVIIVIFETTVEKTILRSEYENNFQIENNTAFKITSLSGTRGAYLLGNF